MNKIKNTRLVADLPKETKEIHDNYYKRSDYCQISEALYGNRDYRQKVQMAILKCKGEAKLIAAIVSFYNSRMAFIDSLDYEHSAE